MPAPVTTWHVAPVVSSKAHGGACPGASLPVAGRGAVRVTRMPEVGGKSVGQNTLCDPSRKHGSKRALPTLHR
jgi:hypothetical protein